MTEETCNLPGTETSSVQCPRDVSLGLQPLSQLLFCFFSSLLIMLREWQSMAIHVRSHSCIPFVHLPYLLQLGAVVPPFPAMSAHDAAPRVGFCESCCHPCAQGELAGSSAVQGLRSQGIYEGTNTCTSLLFSSGTNLLGTNGSWPPALPLAPISTGIHPPCLAWLVQCQAVSDGELSYPSCREPGDVCRL